MDKKIADWLRENDIYVKMHAALDLVRNSGGDALFEGLQNGKGIVEITYNGEYIHFTAHPQDSTYNVDTVTQQIADRPMSSDVFTREPREPIKDSQMPDPEATETPATEEEPIKKKRSKKDGYTA